MAFKNNEKDSGTEMVAGNLSDEDDDDDDDNPEAAAPVLLLPPPEEDGGGIAEDDDKEVEADGKASVSNDPVHRPPVGHDSGYFVEASVNPSSAKVETAGGGAGCAALLANEAWCCCNCGCLVLFVMAPPPVKAVVELSPIGVVV